MMGIPSLFNFVCTLMASGFYAPRFTLGDLVFEKKIAELRADYPELATAYDMLKSLDAKINAADESMGETVGKATTLLKTGLTHLHDGVRRVRGGNPEAEG